MTGHGHTGDRLKNLHIQINAADADIKNNDTAGQVGGRGRTMGQNIIEEIEEECDESISILAEQRDFKQYSKRFHDI